MNSDLSKKKIKYIRANWRNLSVEQMAKGLNVDEASVRKVVSSFDSSGIKTETKNIPVLQIKNYEQAYIFQKIDYIIFLLLFAVSLGLYTYTMSPGIAAGDCGELTCAAFFIAPAHSPGYPLYVLVGKLFINLFIFLGRPVYRLTFFSAFGAAVTVSVLYLFLVKLVGRLFSSDNIKKGEIRNWLIRVPAIITTLLMMFSDELWAQAVIAEVYTLNSLFCPILLLILIKWQERYLENNNEIKEFNFEEVYWNKQVKLIYLFAFTIAVGLANHHTIIAYLLPCVFLMLFFMLKRIHFYIVVFLLSLTYLFFLFPIIGIKSINPIYILSISSIAVLAILAYNNVKLIVIGIIATLFVGLGALIYLSPMIRSFANPPLDWGNPEVFSNLVNIIIRKQYQGFAQSQWSLLYFKQQLLIWLNWKFHQWTYLVTPFIFLGLFRLFKRDKQIFYFSISFILYYDLPFLFFNKFLFTPRDEFFSSVFWIPSYTIMCIWICYGFFYVFESIISIIKWYSEVSRNTLIKISIALGLIVAAPAIQNWYPNFLHNNVANDNYGRNILKTMEKDAYLLTEGGDNQVFSLLYHTYVEHLRPDVDIYDQKGNVFVQLYGDMRHMSGKTLRERNVISDHHLMLQKDAPIEVLTNFPKWWRLNPTYGEGGLKAIERFKPGRPVFYTWRDQRRIREINKRYKENWEYRQAGILYRICERKKPFIHPIQYWDHYDFYWQKHQKEAVNWDYLAREILANYNFQIGDYHFQKSMDYIALWQLRNMDYNDIIKKYGNIQQVMPDEFEYIKTLSQAEVLNVSMDEEEKGYKFYRISEKFGYDMTAIHYNFSIFIQRRAEMALRQGNVNKYTNLMNKAVERAKRASIVDPKELRVYTQIAGIYERLSKVLGSEKELEMLKKAKASHEKALSINPKYNKAIQGIKHVDGLLKYPKNILSNLEKQVFGGNKDVKLYYDLLNAYKIHRMTEEALKLTKMGARKFPNDWRFLNELATLYYQKKNYREAYINYEKLIRFNPHDPNLYNILAQLSETLKNTDKAIHHYRQVISQVGMNPQFSKLRVHAERKIRELSGY